MSSGSYFTMYRKYSVKATDEVFNSLQKQYLDEYKSGSSSSGKKTDAEYLKDLPIVLEFSYGKKETKYDEDAKKWIDIRDYSIDGQRAKYLALLKEDRSYLDELLVWNFCSGFTCLKEEWCLDGYVGARSQRIISKLEAEQMLQACNYLLSNEWSDSFEKILNNPWIRTISHGNRGDSYWKYIYRNDKKSLKEISDEELESAEYDIRRMQHVLDSYVSVADEFDTNVILVYTAW